MTRDADLLAQCAAAPGDAAAIGVYADWLEEHGEADRAAFLRTELALRTIAQDAPAWVGHVEAARALVARLPRAWTSAFSYPDITDRVYEGLSNGNRFVCRFLATKQLNYTQATGSYQNGTWWQLGSLVFWEMNKHYADYVGTLANGGTLLVGDAGNIAGSTWVFRLTLTSKPEVVAIPDKTNTTVYAYGENERKPRPPLTATATGLPPPRPRKRTREARFDFPFDFEMAQLDTPKPRKPR